MKQINHDIKIFLDVKETMEKDEREKIEREIGQLSGISNVEFSKYVPRMLLVNYNMTMTNAQDIRFKVDQLRESGLPPATLVGF